MTWTEPPEWEPGLSLSGIDWAPRLNAEIADNLQFLFDNFTNVRGVYQDIDSHTLQATWSDVATLTLNNRHEAILLTVIGAFPAGSQLRYIIDTNPPLTVIDATEAKTLAKQFIIPALVPGSHAVQIQAQGSGAIRSLQLDIRELT